MHILASTYFAVIVTSTTCFPLSKSFHDRRLLSNSRISEQYHHDPFKSDASACRSLYRTTYSRNVLRMAAADMNWDPKSGPKLDFNEDYYSVLEMDPEITAKEMKKAYYKIVFKYHPDNKEGKEQKDLCNKQMMVINAAYKVLKDGDARSVYDRKRRMGVYGEAAKAGKSTSGSNNGKTQTTQQQSQNTRSSSYSGSSSSSSSSSSSDPFGSYGYKQNKEDNYEATESLGDIFGDLWSEIRKGKTENLVDDLLDFLEDQVKENFRRIITIIDSSIMPLTFILIDYIS